ncbi:MAG: integrase core domain-containing protein [Verrucomicrobiia bacterium]
MSPKQLSEYFPKSLSDFAEIRTWSHPFVERLIRSVREEYLDQLFYWNLVDLEQKLAEYQSYFNESRVHQSLAGDTPAEKAGGSAPPVANLFDYGWQSQCHGLVQLPIAA